MANYLYCNICNEYMHLNKTYCDPCYHVHHSHLNYNLLHDYVFCNICERYVDKREHMFHKFNFARGSNMLIPKNIAHIINNDIQTQEKDSYFLTNKIIFIIVMVLMMFLFLPIELSFVLSLLTGIAFLIKN